ncbi:MAG: hypothetical protein WCK49_03615 [Myxococcaceae bacterium]
MKPWERQDNESSPAFEAFVMYRDTQPRSLRKVSESLSKSKSLIGSWSKTHTWGQRCQQWDNELDNASQQTQLDATKEMKRRQIDMAIEMQRIACEAFKLLRENLSTKTISADNSVRMADIGAKLERLNRDEPSSIERVQESDFSKFTTEELFTYRALLLKSGHAE